MPITSASELKTSGFSELATSIWICQKFQASGSFGCSSNNVGEPALVVLCPWTGAMPKHIIVYTDKYQELYPSAHIMVITTLLKDLCFRNSESKQEGLLPAVERIGVYPRILMHVFSEGGSNKACELADAYKTEYRTLLPVSALCLDSTPGIPRYRRLCNAFSKALPPVPLMRPAGLVLGGVVVGCIWILYCGIKGFESNVISQTGNRLLDPNLWNLTAPRCYLFSVKDTLISWKDVDNHVRELKKKEENSHSRSVVFDKSDHVQHAVDEPIRYWQTVQNTWQMAVQK
jgi:hypothetical protein